MRLLFNIDTKDYNIDGTKFIRPSSRAIIIKNSKIAVIHSLKRDFYKIPGGGIEKDETPIEALIREVKEETGLIVIPSSIKEYGYIHRIQKGKREDVFIQDNYFYLCDCEEQILPQELSNNEKLDDFKLEYISPEEFISKNKNFNKSNTDMIMIQRESKLIELLITENYFK